MKPILLAVGIFAAGPVGCVSSTPREAAVLGPIACEDEPGWGPLRWDMAPEAAVKAFDAAKIAYRYDETRAYSAAPEEPGSPPARAPISHTSSPSLFFKQGSFSGTVRFDEHARMTEISFESAPFHDQASADALIADLLRCHGPAEQAAAGAAVVDHRWQRSTSTLWVGISADTAARVWRVSKRLTPRPPP